MNADPASLQPAGGAQAALTYPHAMRLKPWAWHIVYVLSLILLRIRHRIVVRGSAVPPGTPVLIAAKHASGFDIPLLTWVSKRFLRTKPYFQMGSFIGYTVLGRIVPIMRALGGFPVMRPKEVLRLRKREGMDRERIHAMMDEVNGIAEATRVAILQHAGVLVFFPEGTRDDRRVNPIKGTHEIESARRVAAASPVQVWPVVLSYGPPRFFRRLVLVDFLPPFDLGRQTVEEVSARLAAAFEQTWVEPGRVAAAIASA